MTDELVERCAKARFERWQQILWEGGAKTIEWEELTRSEKVMELDCTRAIIPIVLEEAATMVERGNWDRSMNEMSSYAEGLQHGADRAAEEIAQAIRSLSSPILTEEG